MQLLTNALGFYGSLSILLPHGQLFLCLPLTGGVSGLQPHLSLPPMRLHTLWATYFEQTVVL